MTISHYFAALTACFVLASPSFAQIAPESGLETGNISGTVTDTENDVVPGATVVLEGPASAATRTAASSDTGGFAFNDVAPGGPYHLSVRAEGYAAWNSPAVEVQPGQFMMLSPVRLAFSGGVTSVTVYASSTQLATEQVNLEEKQRVLGIVPNFYVVYDPHPAPLTTKLKFHLALRAGTDPATIAATALLAGMDQAGDTPDYPQGATGFGQRFGANYATGFSDILIGGAILPSLLHQDPRYYYQGTGGTRSRVFHALSAPFICKGDNGRWQPNYSSVGGDLAAGGIAAAYYPATDRGAAPVFTNALITTGGRMVNAVIQEFVLRGLTTGARNQHD